MCSSAIQTNVNQVGNPMYIDRNLVQRMKDTYLPGTRIELVFMGDDPRPIAQGTRGTVRVVDDMGTVHCNFDNGRSLGLVPGEDVFRAIAKEMGR